MSLIRDEDDPLDVFLALLVVAAALVLIVIEGGVK